MATIYMRLNAAVSGFASGVTVSADDTSSIVQQILNSDLATVVANPGGTIPAFAQDAPAIAAGAQAATLKVNLEGASDAAGSVEVTALAAAMAAGVLFTVTFAVPRTQAPRAVCLSDRSPVSVGAYVSAKSATGFTVSSRTAATASAVIDVDYAIH